MISCAEMLPNGQTCAQDPSVHQHTWDGLSEVGRLRRQLDDANVAVRQQKHALAMDRAHLLIAWIKATENMPPLVEHASILTEEEQRLIIRDAMDLPD